MKINNKLLDLEDFIVEQGTSGIWTYRKWNSGIAECWGTTSVNTSFNGTSGNVSYNGTSLSSPTYPTNLFIDTPDSLTAETWGVSGSGTHCYLTFTTGHTKTSPSNFYIFRNASTTTTIYTIYISYEVKGRWK